MPLLEALADEMGGEVVGDRDTFLGVLSRDRDHGRRETGYTRTQGGALSPERTRP